MAEHKAMGKSAFFKKDETKVEKVFTPEQEAAIRADQLKDSVTHEWTTATFKVRKTNMKKLRDYAYTERIEIKEALDQALETFLADKTDLLEAPEKPITTRKRGK